MNEDKHAGILSKGRTGTTENGTMRTDGPEAGQQTPGTGDGHAPIVAGPAEDHGHGTGAGHTKTDLHTQTGQTGQHTQTGHTPAVGHTPATGHTPGHTEAGTEANGLGSAPARLLPGDTEVELRARWKELQTAFVDGPKHAVEEADTLVFDLTKRIEQSITARHRALRESWHGGEAGTEQYRLALRDYRDFVGSLLRL